MTSPTHLAAPPSIASAAASTTTPTADDDSQNAAVQLLQDLIASDATPQQPTNTSTTTSTSSTTTTTTNTDHTDEGASLLAVLKRYFGYSSFRPFQLEAIQHVLHGGDVLVVMATSAGKSLMYQLPSLYKGGVTIVLSPLISLMMDQCLQLRECNVRAAFLGSAQQDPSLESRILAGELQIVYITPEKLVNWTDQLQTLHKRVGITLFAVDECHCVSEWGFEFRADYRSIGPVIRHTSGLSDVPVMALTATATRIVQNDVISSLQLRPARLFVAKSSFNRPNLFYECREKSSPERDLGSVLHFYSPPPPRSCSSSSSIHSHSPDGLNNAYSSQPQNDPTIIYCPTVRDCENLATLLQEKGVRVQSYHAQMDTDLREQIQKEFLQDKIDVVCATVAFGMGINHPSVRRVIHYGAPKTLEEFYQQSGRAGRDGQPARCTLFYSAQDFARRDFYLRDINDQGIAANYKTHLCEKMNRMHQYVLLNNQCRRRFLLLYFDETPDWTVCNNCDICTAQKNQIDYTKEVALLLQTILSTGERFGITLPITVLRGSKKKDIVQRQFDHLPTFGRGTHRSEKFWKALAFSLMETPVPAISATPASAPSTIDSSTPSSNQNQPASAAVAQPFLMNAQREQYSTIRLSPHAKQFVQLFQHSPAAVPQIKLNEIRVTGEKSQTILELTQRKVSKTESPPNDASQKQKQPRKQTEVKTEQPDPSLTQPGAIGLSNSPAKMATTTPGKHDDEAEEELWDTTTKALYGELEALRRQFAEQKACPGYVIFNNRALELMARLRPSTVESFGRIDGVGLSKQREYGAAFVSKIVEWCRQHGEATEVFNDRQEALMVPTDKADFTDRQTEKEGQSETNQEEQLSDALYDLLVQLRLEISREKHMSWFLIFHNKTLKQIAQIRPGNMRHFRMIEGIGDKKCREYGARFLHVIQQFCQQHGLAHNRFVNLLALHSAQQQHQQQHSTAKTPQSSPSAHGEVPASQPSYSPSSSSSPLLSDAMRQIDLSRSSPEVPSALRSSGSTTTQPSPPGFDARTLCLRQGLTLEQAVPLLKVPTESIESDLLTLLSNDALTVGEITRLATLLGLDTATENIINSTIELFGTDVESLLEALPQHIRRSQLEYVMAKNNLFGLVFTKPPQPPQQHGATSLSSRGQQQPHPETRAPADSLPTKKRNNANVAPDDRQVLPKRLCVDLIEDVSSTDHVDEPETATTTAVSAKSSPYFSARPTFRGNTALSSSSSLSNAKPLDSTFGKLILTGFTTKPARPVIPATVSCSSPVGCNRTQQHQQQQQQQQGTDSPQITSETILDVIQRLGPQSWEELLCHLAVSSEQQRFHLQRLLTHLQSEDNLYLYFMNGKFHVL